MKPAIRASKVSKQYSIGTRNARDYRTLREAITDAATLPLRRLHRWGTRAKTAEAVGNTIWSLKDVSFEIQPGEVVGIIGRNGAGKSTLLKVLSRITEPTSGRVELRGRVGSLLEVGTGFHHELTGRENIYLNGAILGMTRREIARKFDEIVAFAEIEKFLDTPAKRYSSGMYMRLGFAVAAHLDPEILLVDEVLAVGDVAFQKKCLGKMREVGRSGRTVLFVSHDMAAVLNLCARGIVLQGGEVVYAGNATDAVKCYLENAGTDRGADINLENHPSRRRWCQPYIRGVRLLNRDGLPTDRFLCGEAMTVEVRCDPVKPVADPQIGIGVHDWMGMRIFTVATYLSNSSLPPLEGPSTFRCHVDELPLVPGRYALSFHLGHYHEHCLDGQEYAGLLDVLDHAVSFEVEPSDFFGTGRIPKAGLGRTLVRSRWEPAGD
ncbi:MAG TPA: ABC transporter ATP-binding protein [Gemmataceae bacterium]|nr:ABC transporter ATP-binding protein [Gemmataceae bacterium]